MKYVRVLAACVLILGSHDALGRPGADSRALVVFNTKTLKVHRPSCIWAKRCTVNCISVPTAMAKAHGGVPCRVCVPSLIEGASDTTTLMKARDSLVLAATASRRSDGQPARFAAPAGDGAHGPEDARHRRSGAHGYQGVQWGTSCSEALTRFEADGAEFSSPSKQAVIEGQPGSASSPVPPRRRLDESCYEGALAAVLDGERYSEVPGGAGQFGLHVFCRAGRFVGVALVADLDDEADRPVVRSIVKAAGPEASSYADGSKRVVVLRPKGDAERYLEADREPDSSGYRLLRYYLLSREEDVLLRRAQARCEPPTSGGKWLQ